MKNNFRYDINGLRAVAVLSVLIFHFDKTWLPGGFAGVDVFFVISGYLMTSIIFRRMEQSKFQLSQFIKDRARRIVPALMTVIALSLFLGYFLIEPSLYKMMGKHAEDSLLFISNITYNNESDYFDSASSDKFFLHTWSLSVEWQFYIIYPIVILLLSKVLATGSIKKIIIFVFFISILASIYVSIKDKTSAYFLLYSRSWEMLAGAIAYLYPIKIKEKFKIKIEALALFLIVLSFILFTEKTLWPSYNALLPVFGTYLCLICNNENSLLKIKPLQFIGLISYSIYLIHWPLLVFLNQLFTSSYFVLFLAITILLSFFLYQLIEKRRNYHLISIMIFLVVLFFSFIVSKNGLAGRVNEEKAISFHKEYYGGNGFDDNGELQHVNYNGDDNAVALIIVGDSLARQYANALKDKGINYVGIFQDGCYSIDNYYYTFREKNKSQCVKRNESLKEAIIKYKNAQVLVAQRWEDALSLKNITTNEVTSSQDIMNFNSLYFREMTSLLSGKQKIFVLALGQGTKQKVYDCMLRNKLPLHQLLNTSCTIFDEKVDVPVNDKLKSISNNIKNINVVDINDYLCDSSECRLTDNQQHPIYSDDIHFSKYGSAFIVDALIRNNIINTN